MGVIRKYIWDINELEFPGHVNGKNGIVHLKLGLPLGQPRLYIQHAYRSVGQKLQSWDTSDKASTVKGSRVKV